jgi:tetratricopeptide (TPR) repeat protein
VLSHAGASVTLEELTNQVFLPGRKGSVQVEMLAAPRRYGLVTYAIKPNLGDVVREIAAGNPVVVLQDYGAWPIKLWHYAVAIGYDADTGHLLMRSGTTERHKMTFALFEYSWQGSAYWAMTALPPGRIPATAEPARYLSAVAALEGAKQPEAAATAYRAMLERWPDNAGASVGLANAYYAQKNLAQAEAVLRKAASVHPEDVVILNNLAQTLSDAGKNDEALKFIERAAALESPHTAAARDTHALILERLQSRRSP